MSLLDFSYNFDLPGLNINTLGTYLDVTSSGTHANILVGGYTFNITGTSALGDIEFIPLISSNCRDRGLNINQCNTNFEIGFTMKDSSSFEPTTLHESDTLQNGIGITFDALYLIYNDNFVYKFSTVDGTMLNQVEYGADSDSVSYETLVVYDHNTAYISYLRYKESTYRKVLSKIDFCTNTETEIYSWLVDYDSNDYLQYAMFTMKHVYEGEEVIIVADNWTTDDDSGDSLKVIFYSITKNEITDLDRVPLNADGYALSWFFNYFTYPTFYEDKLIFTAGPQDWIGVDPSPLPTTCVFPTFILDITNKTVGRNDDITIDTGSIWPYVLWGNCIDRDNGYYYYFLEDYKYLDPGTSQALAKIDLNTNTGSIYLEDLTEFVYVLQGDTIGYGVSETGGVYTLVTIPDLTALVTLSGDISGVRGLVDERNDRVWFYDEVNHVLLGYSTIGDATKTITISWVGGTPFRFANSQQADLLFLAGQVYFFAYSSEFPAGAGRQRDWYLLRETWC